MRENGIRAKAKRKFRRRERCRRSNFTKAPDRVQRRFNPNRINSIWAADLTLVSTREGWCYLAVLMDLCSRRIVAWAISNKQNTTLTKTVLLQALRARKPGQDLIHHSDQGSQYANHEYHAVLNKYGIKASMGERKTCYDNAVVESFFHTLKMEKLYWYRIKTRKEAYRLVFDFIERFYNPRRLHSTLGFKSPIDYEKEMILS